MRRSGCAGPRHRHGACPSPCLIFEHFPSPRELPPCPASYCNFQLLHPESVSLVCHTGTASVGFKAGSEAQREDTCLQSNGICRQMWHWKLESSLAHSSESFLYQVHLELSPVKLQAELEAGAAGHLPSPAFLSLQAGVTLTKGNWGYTGSTYLPSMTARGPASSAPTRPPRGYRETMRDHTSRTRWSGSGWPERACHV